MTRIEEIEAPSDSSATNQGSEAVKDTAGERLWHLLSDRSGFFEGVDDDIVAEIKAEIDEFIKAERARGGAYTGGRYAGLHSRGTLYAVEGESGVFCDWGGKQVRLATVHSPDWHEDYLCASREAFSNACMFSAAFEMYDALTKWKRAQDYQALYQDLPDARDDIAAAWEDALAAREAAVAKAEGRAPATPLTPPDPVSNADEVKE